MHLDCKINLHIRLIYTAIPVFSNMYIIYLLFAINNASSSLSVLNPIIPAAVNGTIVSLSIINNFSDFINFIIIFTTDLKFSPGKHILAKASPLIKLQRAANLLDGGATF